MENLERAQERLEHIRLVQPILNALHSIAMGSWQAALRQADRVQRYQEQLEALLPWVLAHIDPPRGKKESGPRRVSLLVVGSERGLCGQFNTTIVERALAYLTQPENEDVEMVLMALGNRTRRLLERRDHEPAWSGALSITSLPPLGTALNLVQRWLRRYEAGEIDAIEVAYNAYRGPGKYEPTVTRLIPPPLTAADLAMAEETWNAPIIETDPRGLYAHIAEQWSVVTLYHLLLDSAAAEHAARYRLMESATQNTEQLIEELTLTIQTARQQVITREMLELAAGAGMVGPQKNK